MASANATMENVIFDNVVFTNPKKYEAWDDYYNVENVNGIATGNTYPIPHGFKNQTTGNVITEWEKKVF